MRWKWIFSFLIALTVVLTLTAYVIVSRYDFNDLKPRIARAVEGATGRELRLAGDVEIDLGLTPALTIENVSFQNASWGSRPNMATIQRLELRVAVLPLLRGTVDIRRLVLIQPDILIESGPEGRTNLDFKASKGSTPGEDSAPGKTERPSKALPLVFDDLQIIEGNVTFSSHGSQQDYHLDLRDATAVMTPEGKISLEVAGSYNQNQCKLKATFGGLAEITNPEVPWPVDLSLDIADTSVSTRGSVVDLLELTGVDLNVDANGNSVADLLKIFGLSDIPEVGPFRVSGRLTDSNGRFAASRVELTVGTVDLATVSVQNGQVDDIASFAGVSLDVEGKGNSVAELLKVFGVSDVPDVGPFQVSGKLVDSKGRFSAKGVRLDLGTEDFASVSVRNGHIDDMSSFEGIGFSATGKGRSLQAVLEIFHLSKLPEIGAFEVSGNVDARDGAWNISDLKLLAGRPDTTMIELSGNLRDVTTWQGTDVDFSVQGENIEQITSLFDKPIPVDGPFQVSGHASGSSEKLFTISSLKADVGKSSLEGSVTLALGKDVPMLTSTLRAERLDLVPWLESPSAKKTESSKKKRGANGKGKLFSKSPLPFKDLERMNAELDIAAARLELPLMTVEDFSTQLDLRDGNLRVRPIRFGTADGRFEGSLKVRQSGNRPVVTTAFEVDGLNLGHVFQHLESAEFLNGAFDMDVNLTGKGVSVADLMAGLDGKTVIVMKEGNLDERLLGFLGGDLTVGLLELANPFKKDKQYTRIHCLVVGLNFDKGFAESSALLLDTDKVTVVGHGKADLKKETLDVSFKPTPKKGVGIKGLGNLSLSLGQLTKPLKLTGTFADPSVTVDPTETLLTLGKAVGGAALLGPVGLAAALASGKLGGKDPCLAAIEATEKGK